jgi:4-amino-4-deoxy-L-arabinose transferase-like glycosyltransferase
MPPSPEGSCGCLLHFQNPQPPGVNTPKPASPKPALVTHRGARRLPRVPLLLLCAAYVVPGMLGRDPWRNADLTAFGQMAALAEGRTPWWTPMLGGVQADTALLPHWLGAAFIALTSGFLDPALAARVPFAVLLALTLALVWYTAFHLGRTDAAQPVAFAFGGEASRVDYARAVADGAVLALMASLGLLRLGHETTPELAQLCALTLYTYALAAAPFRLHQSRWAVMAALPLLAGSGAPAMALALGLLGGLVCWRSHYEPVRALTAWVAASVLAAMALAFTMGAWHWRVEPPTVEGVIDLLRQWLWFMWPAWPLALWTLWRWRLHLMHRHLAVPLVAVSVSLGANIVMGGNDRALMLGLPGLAVLAVFALPTLRRSAAAAIDWFSMSFFTLFAVWIWFVYAALQTGVPAWQAANVARLLPGYESQFSPLALGLATAGSAAWVWLVRWRTGRHREALWKSLVLPAGGVALCWLLLMTLWLQPLDYARSPRPLITLLAALLPRDSCVAAPGMAPASVAALEVFGHWKVDARPAAAEGACRYLVRSTRSELLPTPAGWELLGQVQRPTDREDLTRVYRRIGTR